MSTKTSYTVLVLNPGSTSTKIAWYLVPAGSKAKAIEESSASLPAKKDRGLEERLNSVLEFIGEVETIDCIASRGGMVRPVPAGTYEINDAMVVDLKAQRYGSHPSNFGAQIAAAVSTKYSCPAIVCDPVGVDEFPEVARYSGIAGIERKSFSHALNLRAAARATAETLGKKLADVKLVGVHLGGGISVAAIDGGRIIDVNNSNEGGPFSPQRTGGLPVLQLIDLCFSGRFENADSVKLTLTREGGLRSYLGTDRVEEILRRISQGDANAEAVLKALAYQVSKEAGAMAAVLRGAEGIFLTGGFAETTVGDWIRESVEWIAPVTVIRGEREMQALADAAARLLNGEEAAKEY